MLRFYLYSGNQMKGSTLGEPPCTKTPASMYLGIDSPSFDQKCPMGIQLGFHLMTAKIKAYDLYYFHVKPSPSIDWTTVILKEIPLLEQKCFIIR